MLVPPLPIKKPSGKSLKASCDLVRKPFQFIDREQAAYSCAREALYYGLSLLRKLSGRIHVPAYCCKSVLLPLDQRGLTINYYDVNQYLEPLYGKEALKDDDIFLLIHYFGIPQKTEYIKEIFDRDGLIVVEDCAHTLPEPGHDGQIGLSGSFSIFSLRKLLPVADGGVLIVNAPWLVNNMAILPSSGVEAVSWKRKIVTDFDRLAFALNWSGALLIKDSLKSMLGSTDDVFSARVNEGSVPGISSDTIGVLGHTDFCAVAEIRRRNYRFLSENLRDITGCRIPFPLLPAGAVPQAFPVLLENAGSVCGFLREQGIGACRWPDAEIPEGISWRDFPGAQQWVNKLVLLPLHQDLNEEHLDRIVSVMKRIL